MNGHTHGEQLSAYLDGMLDVAQMRLVAQHLDQCADCRGSLESLRETRRLLRGLTAPPPPGPEFWANTFRRLRVESGTVPSSRNWKARFRLGQAGVPRRWAAGAVAAAMLGGMALGPWLTHPAVLLPASPSVVSEDFIDMSSLVRAHADSAAREPLADPDRQAMISADTDALGLSGDASAEAPTEGESAAADAAQ